MKSTDISLDRQASSASIMKSTDISLDRQASSASVTVTDADEACRSSEISVDFIIIVSLQKDYNYNEIDGYFA